ncbi:CASP, C-terminal [Kalmanozyma brasiliensis GHG001]|uniref:Protein CASP n=1 Tax=Kalmanozyma brasiliensis (strain GHG001) TaxID=1365824 RepID=V5E9L6_KALBG|nr:CASP, C-terminal [Kalmanozyma brasiliensis GHG001]EST07026.1 CASP, C-terminal [Kalmanozyma brasiliensis GHG001]
MAAAPPPSAAPYTISSDGAGAGPSRPPIDFSAALTTWRTLNLPSLQATLNTVAPTLLSSQKSAVASRKLLADQTREFKKQPDAGKLESFKPLLKSYQAEIDVLTKRSKVAENAFLQLQGAIGEAPDPYPLLEIVLEQAASLNDLETLRKENARLKEDLTKTSSEAEASKARESENATLQQKLVSLEQDFDSRLQQRSSALESELSAKWDERIRNLKSREADLTKSLHVAQEQLQLLKSRDESATARLLEKGPGEDASSGNGNFAEVEMLSRDLERAQARVENVERRNEQLRVEIEGVKSGRQESESLRKLEIEASEKDRKLAQMQSMLEHQKKQSEELAKQITTAREDKSKAHAEKQAELDALRLKLQQRGDYDEIKRELDIVKAVHFNVEDEEEGDAINGDGDQSFVRRAADSLEGRLLEKNKRLEDRLATMRVANAELSTSLTQLNADLAQLRQDHSHLKSLNEKLEVDLASVGRDRRPTKGVAAMSAEEALREMESLEAQASQPRTITPSAAPRASPSTPSADSNEGILPIVTSQRDRFRARNAELEEELRRQSSTISELRGEIKTLQTDNLGLYEKVRYLQSYGPTTSREAVIPMGVAARSVGEGDKYRARYEEAMNPFAAFRGQERSRALSQLNPLEKALHVLTRVVMSHRRMRVFFMAYAIALHLLVFGMLLEVSSTSSADTCALPKSK